MHIPVLQMSLFGDAMKKTQRKDAVRGILKQKAAWISMACVILVGIIGLLLASGVGVSLEKSADAFYAGTDFQDAELTYALGFSDESIKRLAALESVEKLEGIRNISAMMQQTEDPFVWDSENNAEAYPEDAETTASELWPVHILSCTEQISTPKLIKGKLPETEYECALDEELARRTGLQIGDWIELQGDRALPYRLNNSTMQITGLIQHPRAVIRMRADTVLLHESAFNELAGYTGVLVTFRIPEDIRAYALSDEYLARIGQEADVLKSVLPEIAEARIEEVRSILRSRPDLTIALATKGLTISQLEQWLAGPDPDWETADPAIQAIRPDIEESLESLNMDLPTASALYNETVSSDIVVQDRRMNESYEYLRSMKQTISRIGLFFAPLFAVIGSIVFFSSTLILISDERYQVGAMKAIGFDKRTIRKKYLVFGVSAAVAGCLAGVAASFFVNSRVLDVWDRQFSIGGLKSYLPVTTVALIWIPVLAAVVLVVCAACRRLLNCSAIGLISGNEPKRKGLVHKSGRQRKHSLYSELILNNIRTEKSRSVTTVIVVAMSVLLIGTSITLRQDLQKTFRTQTEDVNKYDLALTFPVSMADYSRMDLEDILMSFGAEWAPAYMGGAMAEAGQEPFACSMLCMDRDQILNYFNVGVPETEGVAVSYNLSAAYGLRNGDSLTLYSRRLNPAETMLAGAFEYHIGNLLVIPADTYCKLFDSECGSNSYLVRCSEGSHNALVAAIAEFNEDHSDKVYVETVADSTEQFRSIETLYDLIAGVTIFLVAAMNLLILVNLTQILVSRRMKELLLMRVNGFSIRQVRTYLFREILYVTLPGILLGIAGGIPFTLFMLRRISTMKITLVVQTVWYAWVIAAVLCAVLAFIVFRIAFRKVRQASLVSIPKQ